jgi:hypothetical protein
LSLAGAAQAHSVAIVQLSTFTSQQLETVERLRGELLAVGFSAKVVHQGAYDLASEAKSKQAWVETAARTEGVDAFIVTFWGADVTAPLAVEVWTRNAAGQYQLIRVGADAHLAPRELAIRAVEVLRSALLEAEMNSSSEAAPPGPALTDVSEKLPAPPPSLPSSQTLGLAAGVVLLSTLDKDLVTLPTLQLEAALAPLWALHLEVAGFGYRPAIASGAGTVKIGHTHAALGARYRFLPDSSLRPFLALAVGAQRTSVAGHANAPFEEDAVARWSLLVTAGGGVEFKFAGSYYLSLSGSVHLLAPGVVVHVLDQVVAENGRPNLALALMLGAWL